uniref:Uncharacterized protein MANES_03G144800 n=1 Tax=Rhizophora mucronata TaxID=61149 RepID=A0A2P2MA19_RHIMU
MHCCGLMNAGSDASRFCLASPSSSANRPCPIVQLRPPTRVPIGSFRTKALINDRNVEEVSFYELLGVPESCSVLEIKQAYKQLARKYHPDVSPPDRVKEFTERFIRVQEAYETLSDPGRRSLYDRHMARGLPLAFSARRRYENRNAEEMEERNEWKSLWEAQLSELERRSMSKDADDNTSWGARMRRQREESSRGL